MSLNALFKRKALLILLIAVVIPVTGLGLYALVRTVAGGASQTGGGVAMAVGLGVFPIAAWIAAFAFALAFKRSWLMEVNLWCAAALGAIGLIGIFSFFAPMSGPLAWFSGYGYTGLGGRLGDAVIGGPGFFGALRALAVLGLAFAVAMPALAADLCGMVGQWTAVTFMGIRSTISRKRGDDDLDNFRETPYVDEPEAPIMRRDLSSMRRDMWGSEARIHNGEVLGLSDNGDAEPSSPHASSYVSPYPAPFGEPDDWKLDEEDETVEVADAPAFLNDAVSSEPDDGERRALGGDSLSFLSASPRFLDDRASAEPDGDAERSSDDGSGVMARDVLSDVPSFLIANSEPRRAPAPAFDNTAELVLDDADGYEDDGPYAAPPWDAEPSAGGRFAQAAGSGRKLNQYWLPEGAGSSESELIAGRASRAAAERSSYRSRPAASAAGMLWKRPDLELFQDAPENPISQAELDETSEIITQTLADYNVDVDVGHIRPGPTVTMYGLVPGWVRKNRRVPQLDGEGKPILNRNGRPSYELVEEKTRVKVSTILQREADLALALKTPSLRIETPAMGRSLVGIEVPNPNPSMVAIRNVMSSNEFQKLRKNAALPIALGRGSGGEDVCFDLAKMPHLLVAGATGSGKSVCLNAIVSCMITEKTPAQVRLLLVDPKRVELTPYNGIPHLMAPVIVETDTVVGYLKGLIREMFDRYRMMEEVGVRNIEAYNKRGADKMPYLCVVVDELADLMMTAAFDVEQSICRLAQLGRATGIHLIIATQRPSVDVVTGLIKANFPSRISFGVTSQVDSRTILDTSGADKLLGRGDMLYLPIDASKPSRVQSVFIGDDEIGDLVNFWQKKPWPPLREIDLLGGEDLDDESGDDSQTNDDPDRDDMLNKAIELAQTHRKLSTSLLQRRLRIGYPRAARLMDQLEEEGIVGPADGAKSRDVIINQA